MVDPTKDRRLAQYRSIQLLRAALHTLSFLIFASHSISRMKLQNGTGIVHLPPSHLSHYVTIEKLED